MKLRVIGAAVLCVFSATAMAETQASIQGDQDQMSYALGLTMGSHIKQQGVPLTDSQFVKGFEDGMSGSKPQLAKEDLQKAMVSYQEKAMKIHEENQKVASDTNQQAGEAFLAENKSKDGVVTLPSGLQYKIVKAGEGESPTKTDQVKVNYEGRLVDGTIFDSSFQRGEPAVFPVNAVISGWTEALQLMKPGAEWELYIPSNLAYGERGVGQIGPNSTLIFKVDLLDVEH